MAEASQPPAVKMICGMLSANRQLFDRAAEGLCDILGRVELASEIMDFDFTHYYDRQMGTPLYRRLVAFEGLTSAEMLVEAKLATNALEERFARQSAGRPARPINLDPGYVESAKLVLASMKNFSHRIYLGRGVYAEVTLMYHKGNWQQLPWTFPDYASKRYDPFLTAVRDALRRQARKEAGG